MSTMNEVSHEDKILALAEIVKQQREIHRELKALTNQETEALLEYQRKMVELMRQRSKFLEKSILLEDTHDRLLASLHIDINI